ncbi:NlpC/P60 family protein [Pseudonocardia oroxyli]|uniref:Cell wall-associated hydrolase, NlpC family n=1 Tax=Pseudonocardia oroxyli TaxID=366584 RepID=A0A1G7HT47_PSEOR|nr:NlpC/P60 family protein [Pseudonocardia oroxyli]SDF03605.1 Cell wall-associated hydrolase, NlpC family [Pseudonocardia oroxyli]
MRVLRGVLVVVLAAALSTTGVAVAQPSPPPNPTNDDLQRSRDQVDQRASSVAQLTQRLADLQAEADDLQIQVAVEHESANQALDVLTGAEAAADAATARAESARAQTEAAGKAIDAARTRLDDFVAGTYSQGLDLGPIGLLTTASGPDDLVDRAQLTDALAQQQAAALDGLQRARVQKANADSAARAAQEEAERERQAAADAKTAADQALAGAQANAAAQAQRLSAVATEQQQVQAQLDAAENADAGLRAQRQRFLDWQSAQRAAELAEQRRAQEEAAGRAAAAPPATSRQTGSAAVQTVIDRAMAQLGVRYSWGGGNSRGPTVGVRDGGVADSFGDYRKVGFDCSGLMLYAFAGAGVNLPRWSGNQATFGLQVPRSQMQPGDMLSWARNGRTYHIALYIGNGRMIEAPYSGASVKISPVRYTGGLAPTVSRVL